LNKDLFGKNTGKNGETVKQGYLYPQGYNSSRSFYAGINAAILSRIETENGWCITK
jgi:hypothetical protein